MYSLCLPPLKVRKANSGLIKTLCQVYNVAREALNLRPDVGGSQPGWGQAIHNLSNRGLEFIIKLYRVGCKYVYLTLARAIKWLLYCQSSVYILTHSTCVWTGDDDVVEAHVVTLNRTGTLLSNHVYSKGENYSDVLDLEGLCQSQTTIDGQYNHNFIVPFTRLLSYVHGSSKRSSVMAICIQ